MKKLYYASFTYSVIGLFLGLFGREYTVANEYYGYTALNVLHTHTLILGFFFFLIVLVISKVYDVHERKGFSIWFIIYNVGFLITTIAMFIRGILEVKGTDMTGLNHIAGLGHVVISVGFIWFMILLGKSIKSKPSVK